MRYYIAGTRNFVGGGKTSSREVERHLPGDLGQTERGEWVHNLRRICIPNSKYFCDFLVCWRHFPFPHHADREGERKPAAAQIELHDLVNGGPGETRKEWTTTNARMLVLRTLQYH